MPDRTELEALAIAIRVLDVASLAVERALLRAYPLIDEDPFFDPHALDDDPHDAAAEIAFVLRSLRGALRRYRRSIRRQGPAAAHPARPAASQRAR
ncbi:MAG: hypothetical protein IT378_19480 [Sandaracinaceae bacterium]|nr:hypothetical protein [Sandaracinaceae bacterium]